MTEPAFTLDTKGLDKLLKALKQSPPMARIGILGDKTQRSEKGSTNAEIGFLHEFGTDGRPVRSFLRMPLQIGLQTALEKAGAWTEAAAKEVLRIGSVVPWLRKAVVVAEGVIADAFDTGGFGEWAPSDMRYKKNHQTLVETQQLRNSITSEVKDQ